MSDGKSASGGGKRFRGKTGAILVAVALGAAIIRAFIYFFPLSNFVSNAALLDDLSYCLGYFDGTRSIRIEAKLGDSADELVRMRDIADKYALMLRRFDITGVEFGPSVIRGRLEAQEAVRSDILNATFHYGKPLENWLKKAEKCRMYSDEAKKRIAAKPERPSKLSWENDNAALINVCACEGRLLANNYPKNAEILAALEKLRPVVDRAKRQLGDKCAVAERSALTSLEPFPMEFLRSTRLLDECYALAASAR